MTNRLIYLASPYSHPDPQVRQYRYEQVLEATRLLMLQGRHVWAPIVYTHQLAEAGMPVEWEFWQAFDGMMLRRCQELWVLTLDGWEESRGIQAEIDAARGLGIRVVLRPGNIEPLRAQVDEHPIGCVCAECEEREVQTAIDERGGCR